MNKVILTMLNPLNQHSELTEINFDSILIGKAVEQFAKNQQIVPTSILVTVLSEIKHGRTRKDTGERRRRSDKRVPVESFEVTQ